MIDQMSQMVMSLSSVEIYLLVFGILLACGLGLPIPEDVTLFASGLASYYGKTDVHFMVLLAFVGVMIGDGFVFSMGRFFGQRLLDTRFFRKIITHEREAFAREKIGVHGNKLIFAARFMPGLRTPVFFTSGLLNLPYRTFVLFDGFAALISVPAIVYTTWYFGDQVDRVIQVVRGIENGVAILIFGIIGFFVLKWYLQKRSQKRVR